MSKVKARIDEVVSFLESKDTVIGFRKLMDCVIDTQNLHLYQHTIEVTDWKEKHPNETGELIKKCFEILKQVEKVSIEEYKTTEPVVSAKGLVKSYGHNRFKLGPVSMDIRRGEVYGLVGENGNGKTTLLRLLAKSLNYTEGELHFNFDKPSNSSYDLKTNLVYIPQRTQRWYGSLKDNLKLVLTHYGISKEENETRVLMMIARLGLWNYKHLKWNELSSGYKMRFELARTLLRQPELLLLDEPLANLDVLAQQVILEDLKSICNSINNPIALILSSQQLYEVEKVSDKVIFLKEGKYKDNTTPVEADNNPLIVEIDTPANRKDLQDVFKTLQLQKLVYNGGIYVAYFDNKTAFYNVLELLGQHKIEVTYTRNISESTRRFFVS